MCFNVIVIGTGGQCPHALESVNVVISLLVLEDTGYVSTAFIYLFIYLSIYLFIYLSIYLLCANITAELFCIQQSSIN